MPYQPAGYDPDAGEFGHIKPGPYAVVVEALELKYGEESQEPYIAWTFVVAEGEFKNRKVWNNTTLQESGINFPTGFYKSIIAALGEDEGAVAVSEIESTEWDDEETLAEHVGSLICGRVVTIAVSNRVYQGRAQNDVIGIKVYSGDMPQLDTEELAATREATDRPRPKAKAKGKGKKAPAPQGGKATAKGGAKADTGF
ncbi:hypothetical protein LCGC14_0846810 [marine sediment metagenome]|uniref:DUF669 domain-containing protein n=1 Tax=marine sediment metagenome TaxID=412755 RepID=A0A0F9PBE0_9ZZZZ